MIAASHWYSPAMDRGLPPSDQQSDKSEIALYKRIIHKLRTMIPGTQTACPDMVILDSFATDNGPADQIKRVENTYQISDGQLGS